MFEEKTKQNRNLLIVGIICLVALVGIVGYTYSFFQVRDTDTGSIVGTVASTSLEIEVEKLVPSTNVGLVPQLDEYITSAVVGRNNKNCVDDNGNEVCQVYAITVTNTSSVSVNVDGLVELNAGNNPNLKWAEITGYTLNMTTKPTLVSSYNSHTTKTLTASEEYAADQTKTYYIVIWISELNEEQNDTGAFTGTVTFKLADNDSPALATLTRLKIAPNVGNPDFSKTSCSSGCGENIVGVYSYPDDLGTSYYFRGDVENNYVYFANKYWRIIRINGDGTIRMIYDGTRAYKNGELTMDTLDRDGVERIQYNNNAFDNAFCGYMNGTIDGTTFPSGGTSSTSYEEAHANITDSTIKDYLENIWYEENFKDTNYEQYIADAIYCNDRSFSPNDNEYTGKSDEYTAYRGSGLLIKMYSEFASDMLKCINPNDRFTLESSNFEIETNGKLNAPVGLITAYESFMAGNDINYLGTKNVTFWTMTPNSFPADPRQYGIFMLGHNNSGLISFKVTDFHYVRPVITLSSNSITGGNGTMTDPFIIN